jgi:hypothetical protein
MGHTAHRVSNRTEDVITQLQRLPRHTSHLAVSVEGNEARKHVDWLRELLSDH